MTPHAADCIKYGLAANDDQLIRTGIEEIRASGYEQRGLYTPLVEAKTEAEYTAAKRKLQALAGHTRRRR